MNAEDKAHEAKKSSTRDGAFKLEPKEEKTFADWLNIINETKAPYVVSGAFAVHYYTSVWRYTKDMDIFIKPDHVKVVLDALSENGYPNDVRDTYWLAKAYTDDCLLDIIFSLGNGNIEIDDRWFDTSGDTQLFGVDTHLVAPEELIASKIYVARSDRFDGSDIVHIIRALQGNLNWDRLLEILSDDSTILLWHLLLFAYVYPGHSDYLPLELLVNLFEKVGTQWNKSLDPKTFRGLVIDPSRFSVDLLDWGYVDARRHVKPLVTETGEKL
jgi:hypothetical protein